MTDIPKLVADLRELHAAVNYGEWLKQWPAAAPTLSRAIQAIEQMAENDARYRWLESRMSRTGLETFTSGELSWQEQRWYHIDYRKPVPQSETLSEYIDSQLDSALSAQEKQHE